MCEYPQLKTYFVSTSNLSPSRSKATRVDEPVEEEAVNVGVQLVLDARVGPAEPLTIFFSLAESNTYSTTEKVLLDLRPG